MLYEVRFTAEDNIAERCRGDEQGKAYDILPQRRQQQTGGNSHSEQNHLLKSELQR